MRILGPSVVARFRIVNTHPSLLPAFPGAHALRDALAAGVPTTGVTVHWVDEGVDTGPVIAQARRPDRGRATTRTRCGRACRPSRSRCSSTTIVCPARAKELSLSKIAVRRALISVYDKTGLDELAPGLHAAGVEIVSTGSTAATIRALGVPVTPVDEVTGFPEILGGRVKTLHPHIHAGLLADQGDDGPRRHGRPSSASSTFQLVVVEPVPVRRDGRVRAPTPPEIIEQIDIGGPAMVRASAKNHGSVAVVVDPARYADVLAARPGGRLRRRASAGALSAAAFRHTAVLRHRGGELARQRRRARRRGRRAAERLPGLDRRRPASGPTVLRYGENPHQRAALYVAHGLGGPGLAQAEQLPARR